MGKRVIWSSDLPDAKGQYTEVANPDELGKVFIGVGGNVYQLDLTEGEQQAFKKAVAKYVTAAEAAHADDDPKLFENAFLTKNGYLRAQLTRSASTTTGTGSTTSAATKKELEEYVKGKFFWKNVDGAKRGEVVKPEASGLKAFVIAMGEDLDPAARGRVSGELYLSALKTAVSKGIVGEGDPDDPEVDTTVKADD